MAVRRYRQEHAELDYQRLCALAGLAQEGVRWSARALYYRLLRLGQATEFATVDAVVAAFRASHRCAEITLHLRRLAACDLGTEHEGCCPGKGAA